jgi:hypothetical protein
MLGTNARTLSNCALEESKKNRVDLVYRFEQDVVSSYSRLNYETSRL